MQAPTVSSSLAMRARIRVTVLRFRYGADWSENGEGIFHIRVRRHGEHTAYNAQLVTEDSEYNCLLMTVTNTELSVKGSGEMQVVYSGENFVKKSPIYSYNVSRAVDEAVDPPAQDVYTEIIESLSDLQTDVQGLSDAVDGIGNLSELTTTAKTDLVSAINEVNEHGGGSTVTVDDALSNTSTKPVQNKVITARINSLDSDVGTLRTSVQSKADTQTVSALSDAIQDLDGDVQGLQTAMQGKADTATVTALSGTVSNLSDFAQQYVEYTNSAITNLRDNKANKSYVDDELATKANAQTVTALSGTVTGLQTSKADKSYVDTQLAEKASAQTVSDLADDVSDLQTELAGKVGDVQINGSSVVTNGVANVPLSYGLQMLNGSLTTSKASFAMVKSSGNSYNPIVPEIQHFSTFYGLAKIAGHDEWASTLPVGTYSEEAKVAIQKMLGIYEAPWELINEETFTNETSANYGIDTDSNGDALELTDAILLFETPQQETQAVFDGSGAIRYYFKDKSFFLTNECIGYTQASNSNAHGCVSILEQNKNMLHLSRIASTTVSNNGTYGSRYGRDFGQPLGVGDRVSYLLLEEPIYISRIDIAAVTGAGHYVLYGKRKWT